MTGPLPPDRARSGVNAGPRWWPLAPDPDLTPIGARRAYGEVLAVYLAFFLVGIVAAGLLLAGRSADVTSTGSWGVYLTAAVDQVMQIGLAVAVVLLLAARRGVRPGLLGLRVPRRADGRVAVSQSIRMMAWCFLAIIAGNIFVALLQTGSLPQTRAAAPELIYSVVQAAQAGVIEELVVLAFVVVTLRQAGRPWWEVTAVALVLRAAYHIYYGPGVVGILIWAALFYCIYLRFRQLLPLMVCHGLWDSVAFLSRASTVVLGVGELMVAALWLTAVILWLIERNNPPAAVPAAGHQPVRPGPVALAQMGAPPLPPPAVHPPPGWHPDPAGTNRWRWWDGHRWTDYMSPH
ncbi:MAG TPA: CPBP family glutamic-type intramembrane protease [Acidimicrobiales bacterium]|nr:CPBP family glutamic-type intramembrane protease [Acidimicrobiales bacterium]